MPAASPHPVRLGILPEALARDIERTGYFPALMRDVVAAALGDEPVREHLVHQETTFDDATVFQHVTVLVLTEGTLVVAHVDDHESEHEPDQQVATASTEIVPLRRVRGVMLTHGVPNPAQYEPGSLGRVVTLTLGWGAVSRLDLIPASCTDPTCEADHGYEGTSTGDDITLRVSADADGEYAYARAISFAQALMARLR